MDSRKVTKEQIRFLREVLKTHVSDEEAAELFKQALILADEIRQEFRQMYDPDERA